MMHKNRRYRVVDRVLGQDISTSGDLARVLTEHDWCTCDGFRLGDLVFLNDSTGPDGAQEYAVFDTRIGKQVESLTVSWMKADELESCIRHLMSDVDLDTRIEPWGELPSLEHPDGVCHACA